MRFRISRVAVVACAALLAGCPPASGPTPAERSCNGHPALCERALDEVVFVGAHNAMAARDDGFLGPNQALALRGQLRFGVRAFLIDTKAPDPDVEGGGVRLCHGSCDLGEVSLLSWLERLAAFLDEEPDNVVQLLVQDEASAADTEADFVAAGLFDELYVHPGAPGDGEPWPTLGALIDDGTRIFLTAETPTTAPEPWFQPMFQLFSDTPFTAEDLAELQSSSSCALNRGPAGADLLLVNHWIGAPGSEEAAAVANDFAVLDERVRRCSDQRGRTANVVAVDFVDTGDVVEVVDGLNGVD